MLRAKETGIDPLDGSTLEEWRNRLETIFSRIIEVNSRVDSLRYIDKNGNELVRVNNEGGNPRIVPIPELQNKAHRDYFQEGIQVREDEIYTSKVELNMEHSKIEIPHKPVLRIATPVFNDEGVQGVIVVNTKIDEIFTFVELTPIGEIVMTDEIGDFVIHSDKEKRFSSQLKTNFNFFTEHPELQQHAQEMEFEDFHDKEKNEFFIWRKVHYNPSNENNYWLLFSIIEEEDLLAPIKELLVKSILIALLAIGIASALIFIIVSKTLKPLVTLTNIINEISQGNTEVTIDSSLKNNDNEIGKLAQAFDRTIVSLKLAINQTMEANSQDKENSEENQKENAK